MKIKPIIRTLLLSIFAMLALNVGAQVTMGSDHEANTGALLDLKEKGDGTSTLGLGMPRVNVTNPFMLFPMFETAPGSGVANSLYNTPALKATQDEAHKGMIVYNTDNNRYLCPGIVWWNGKEWVEANEVSSTDITITPATINLLVGDAINLTAAATAEDPTCISARSYTWMSLNPAVASIDQNGRVTGNADGVVDIVATTKDGRMAFSRINVALLRVAFSAGDYQLNSGFDGVLTATVTPSWAPNKAVTWSATSNNGGVLINSANGHMILTHPGIGTFTATSVAKPSSSFTASYTSNCGIGLTPGTLITGNGSGTGNHYYPIMKYGAQCWMVSGSIQPGYSALFYDNNGAYVPNVGAYYLRQNKHLACPAGWHVPWHAETKIMAAAAAADPNGIGKWWFVGKIATGSNGGGFGYTTSGNFYNWGSNAYYWQADMSASTGGTFTESAFVFYTNSSHISNADGTPWNQNSNAAMTLMVRCVQN